VLEGADPCSRVLPMNSNLPVESPRLNKGFEPNGFLDHQLIHTVDFDCHENLLSEALKQKIPDCEKHFWKNLFEDLLILIISKYQQMANQSLWFKSLVDHARSQ